MGVDVLMARLSADELVDGGDVATPKLETDYGNRGQTDTTTVATPTSTNQKIADTIAAYAANTQRLLELTMAKLLMPVASQSFIPMSALH